MVIAKYRAQAERLEAELAELRAGRQPLGADQALPTHDLTAGAAPAAEGAGTRQAASQQQQQPGQGSNVVMGEAPSNVEDGQSGGRQGPADGGGMWM